MADVNVADKDRYPSAIVIDVEGDLYIDVRDEVKNLMHRYLVSSRKLQDVSVYFKNLLDPAKFKEGAHVAAHLEGRRESLRSGLDSHDEHTRPLVYMEDVPNPSSSSLRDVVRVFFEIVHARSAEEKARMVGSRKVPMSFITRLAIVADRFLAHQSIKPFMDAYHKTQPPSKEAFRLVYSLQNEQYWRQRLLVAVWYGYPNWVFGYSRLLIQHGSEYWSRLEAGGEEATPDAAFWTHIPWGIEEEMMHRRHFVLSTIASLQDFFLNGYTSGKRQCKLGYDTSSQCDSFQLGEMVRFFGKKDVLNLRSSIDGQDWKPSFGGNILVLLRSLRQCPSYQIDSNHAHCGIRTLLVPRVEYLESWMSDLCHGGICLKCWQSEKHTYSWIDNPSKEPWRWQQRSFLNSSTPFCDRQHKAMKEVFTSEIRDWSPDGYQSTKC